MSEMLRPVFSLMASLLGFFAAVYMAAGDENTAIWLLISAFAFAQLSTPTHRKGE